MPESPELLELALPAGSNPVLPLLWLWPPATWGDDSKPPWELLWLPLGLDEELLAVLDELELLDDELLELDELDELELELDDEELLLTVGMLGELLDEELGMLGLLGMLLEDVLGMLGDDGLDELEEEELGILGMPLEEELDELWQATRVTTAAPNSTRLQADASLARLNGKAFSLEVILGFGNNIVLSSLSCSTCLTCLLTYLPCLRAPVCNARL